MASQKGRNGALTGLVGTVVCVTKKNGDYYIRSKPRKGDKTKRTLLQKAVNNKMRLISPLINGKATKFYNISYAQKALALGKTTVNLAKSINLKTGVVVNEGIQEIDYPNFLVAYGDLAVPTGIALKSLRNGFELSWSKDFNSTLAEASDRTMIYAFCADNPRKYFNFSGAKRSELKDVIEIPQIDKDFKWHLYLCFKDVETSEVSNSVYFGEHQMLTFKDQ